MATPRLGLVVEDKPTELSCSFSGSRAQPHTHAEYSYEVAFESNLQLNSHPQILSCIQLQSADSFHYNNPPTHACIQSAAIALPDDHSGVDTLLTTSESITLTGWFMITP